MIDHHQGDCGCCLFIFSLDTISILLEGFIIGQGASFSILVVNNVYYISASVVCYSIYACFFYTDDFKDF